MADTGVRIGPTAIPNSEVTLYTVPAQTTAFVRWYRIVNVTGTAATVKMSVGADAAGTRLIDTVSIPANDYLEFDDQFLVIGAGETLRATGGTNNALTFTGGAVQVT